MIHMRGSVSQWGLVIWEGQLGLVISWFISWKWDALDGPRLDYCNSLDWQIQERLDFRTKLNWPAGHSLVTPWSLIDHSLVTQYLLIILILIFVQRNWRERTISWRSSCPWPRNSWRTRRSNGSTSKTESKVSKNSLHFNKSFINRYICYLRHGNNQCPLVNDHRRQ